MKALLLCTCYISSTFISCLALSNTSSNNRISREIFLKRVFVTSSALLLPPSNPTPAIAADFVPASPFFSNTLNDAIDILSSQRIACDNIVDVINDGNLNEAAFKMMQLTAQTKMGGRIILDSMSNIDSNSSSSNSRKAINTIKFLKTQEKFVILMDTCSECEIQIEKALRGKLGATTAAQIKLLAVMSNVRDAFDEFLLEFLESTTNTTL